MKTMDLLSEECMAAHLVAGRRFDAEMTRAELDGACHAVDAWGERLGLPLVLLAQADLWSVDGDRYDFPWIIGVRIASADSEAPATVAAGDIDNAVAAARTLPWETLAADLPGPFTATDEDEGPPNPYEEARKAVNEQVGVWLVATGGAAGAKLAYGVLFSGKDEAALDPDAGLADAAPGLDVVRGTKLAQDPHEQATYGVRVAGALFCDNEEKVDVSAEARRDLAEKMGDLAAQAGYVLMTHYD